MQKNILIQELKGLILGENGDVEQNCISISYSSNGSRMHVNVEPDEIEINLNDIALESDSINAIFSIRDKEIKKEFDGIGNEYVFLDKTEEIRLTFI